MENSQTIVHCSKPKPSLYIHIPFCASKCRYCSFYSEPVDLHDTTAAISAIIAELNRYDVTMFETVYIGGGSPTSLDEALLLQLVEKLESLQKPDAEFTVECNPGQLTQQLACRLHDLNVNRISIGAQSFQQKELDFLGRTHSVESTEQAVHIAREAGFPNISLDLIFAIPGSTLGSLKHSIHSALRLKPEHISAYSLSYEKGTPLQRACRTGEIAVIDEETDRSMYELVIDELTAAGFEQYEISNFARPGHKCLHNLIYWTNTQYIGIGPGATSYYKGKRHTNIANIKKYVQAIGSGASPIAESHTSTPIETACETAVLNLRRIEGINLEEFKTQTGFNLKELFDEPISQNLKSGLLKEKTDTNGDERISLTRKALPIADTVLCEFSMV